MSYFAVESNNDNMAKCNVNTNERFADIQMLRYELKGFEDLSLNQKLYISAWLRLPDGTRYHVRPAGKYNLRIRKHWKPFICTMKATENARNSRHLKST